METNLTANLSALRERYKAICDQYNQDVGKLNAHLAEKEQVLAKRAAEERYTATLDLVNALLQKTADHQRRIACQQIEALGTSALQYIMGSEYSLHIELVDGGRKPELEIYVATTDGTNTVRTQPQEARGGGVVDIVCLALKLVVIEVCDPKINGPIFLDEPGKHVSAAHTERLSLFLKEFVEKFGRQVILITHNADLANAADRTHKVALHEGASCVQS